MMPLKEHYKTNVVSELKEKLNLESVMAVPKVMKVTLNMGVGEAIVHALQRKQQLVLACSLLFLDSTVGEGKFSIPPLFLMAARYGTPGSRPELAGLHFPNAKSRKRRACLRTIDRGKEHRAWGSIAACVVVCACRHRAPFWHFM